MERDSVETISAHLFRPLAFRKRDLRNRIADGSCVEDDNVWDER